MTVARTDGDHRSSGPRSETPTFCGVRMFFVCRPEKGVHETSSTRSFRIEATAVLFLGTAASSGRHVSSEAHRKVGLVRSILRLSLIRTCGAGPFAGEATYLSTCGMEP